MSAVARLKRAVRAAIHACGGIDGAAATVDKSRSLVGNWNNLNQGDMPTLGDALAIDEIAIAAGKRPEIASALARELGGVFLPLPRTDGASAPLAMRVIELAKELGDVSARIGEALADGEVTPREANAAEAEVDDLIERACALRGELLRLQATVVVPVRSGQRG